MNTRRYSKSLKKSDLINLSNILQEENEILKKELKNLNSLLTSQEDRHKTEVNSLLTENEKLSKTNSQLIQSTIELQEALKLLRGSYQISSTSRESLSKNALTSRSLCKNKENLQNHSDSCKSTKNLDRISPLKAGLLQDSRKLQVLMNKMKRLSKK
jgi:hypothetical protein